MQIHTYINYVGYFKYSYQPGFDLTLFFGNGAQVSDRGAALLVEAFNAGGSSLGVLLKLAIIEKNSKFLNFILAQGASVSDLDEQGNPIWFTAFAEENYSQAIASRMKEQDDFYYFQRNKNNETLYQYSTHASTRFIGISVHQAKILDQLNKYLAFRDSLPQDPAVKMDPYYFDSITRGVCQGLSLLQWFCQHVSAKEARSGMHIEGTHNQTWLENIINTILKWKLPRSQDDEFYFAQMNEIEEFLSFVKVLQDAKELGFSQVENVELFNMMLSGSDQNSRMQAEYFYNGINTPREMANAAWQLLHAGKNVMIGYSGITEGHVVSLYQEDDSVWYYDSSGKMGYRILVKTPQEVAVLLAKAVIIRDHPDTAMPCYLQVNGFGKPGNYPEQSNLFNSVYTGNQKLLADQESTINQSLYWGIVGDSVNNFMNLLMQFKLRGISESEILWIAMETMTMMSASTPKISQKLIEMILKNPSMGKPTLEIYADYFIDQAFRAVRPKIYLLEQLLQAGINPGRKISAVLKIPPTKPLASTAGEDQYKIDPQLIKLARYFGMRMSQVPAESQEYIVCSYLMRCCHNTLNAKDLAQTVKYIAHGWHIVSQAKEKLSSAQMQVHPRLSDRVAILLLQSLDAQLNPTRLPATLEMLSRLDSSQVVSWPTLLKLDQEAKKLIQNNSLQIRHPTLYREDTQFHNVHRGLLIVKQKLMNYKSENKLSQDELVRLNTLLSRFNNTQGEDIKNLLSEAKVFSYKIDTQLVNIHERLNKRIGAAHVNSHEYILLTHLMKRCHNTVGSEHLNQIIDYISKVWKAMLLKQFKLSTQQQQVDPSLYDAMAKLIILPLDTRLDAERTAAIQNFFSRCNNTKDAPKESLSALEKEATLLVKANDANKPQNVSSRDAAKRKAE